MAWSPPASALAACLGVILVTSDAHRGLVEAIGATLPAASWQRCRTHDAANLMTATPKNTWGWVKALLHSVYDQPDADAVHAQFWSAPAAADHRCPHRGDTCRERRRLHRPGRTSAHPNHT
jgi:putative transposase